jgi:hypothetical protein
MNPSRLTFALIFLSPAAVAAADAGAVPDRPFSEVRRDLNDLRTAGPGAAVTPGLDLGAATAALTPGAHFDAPPSVPVPVRPTEPATNPQPARSSGWLLDALEENSRRAANGGPGIAEVPVRSEPEEETAKTNGTDGRPTAAAANRSGAGRDTPASPLSAYLSGWLSPDEYRRLSSLYPELTGGAGTNGKEFDKAEDPLRRGDPALPGAAPGGAESGGLGLRDLGQSAGNAPLNPFVQAMTASPRLATPPVPLVRAQTSAPSALIPSPGPEPAKPAPFAPTRPDAEDRRYYPQLKRF